MAKDGDGELWLLSDPELVRVVEVHRLTEGLMIGRFSRGELVERFEEDLGGDSDTTESQGPPMACVSLCAFISSSEPTESLSRLLSDSAGQRENNELPVLKNKTYKRYETKEHLPLFACCRILP